MEFVDLDSNGDRRNVMGLVLDYNQREGPVQILQDGCKDFHPASFEKLE